MTTDQGVPGTEPDGAPAPIGPYTPVVRAGELLFVSGQLGTVGGELADGLAAQVTAALANLAACWPAPGRTSPRS